MINFIEKYLEYCQGTEPPTIYHRWCSLVGIAALLGRKAFIMHGDTKIYANLYTLLVGESGARKGTAIKRMSRLMRETDYKFFSANRSSQEQFLADLHIGLDKVDDEESPLDVKETVKTKSTMKELFGVKDANEPAECFIALDEFNTFMGHGNINFITCLTDLWDWDGPYKYRFRNGKSVFVHDPTINILGGITSVGISQAFPIEVIGQGFFSRIIMIHSDPVGRRITKIPVPDPKLKLELIDILQKLKHIYAGEITITNEAWEVLDEIYQSWRELPDVRFKSYSTRRFTNLLKLCICCAAAQLKYSIDPTCVEYANTILHYTEYFMPKALGEFGKARNSDVTVQIIELLDKAVEPLDPVKDIWPHVRRDLDTTKQLEEILKSLAAAGKIQSIQGRGLLPKKEPPRFDFPHCNVSLLQEYLETQGKDGLPL